MERRRKYNRHFLQTMHTLLPPVLLVTQLSLVVVLCSFFILIDYAECIMTFPGGESGVYSLFPDEDLKTGRKRLRFDDEAATTIRNYRDGRDYLVRSYPMLPHDRLHRPVDFSGGGGGGGREGSRQVYDDYNRDRDRERHGRVYFDDSFRSSRFDFHRLTPRPRPIERPVNPIIFETSRRPYHHHFLPDSFPPGPPAIGQSKLPPGASSRASGEDVPTRIHVFNPESNSFGTPRNAGGGGGDGNDGTSSSERAKGPPSNFVETGPPGPESFLNHEEFLEYQKKIAFARFHEQDGPSGNGGGGSSSSSSSGGGGAGKKVLFESKEPFEIDGLVPPDKSAENSGKLPTTSKVPLQYTHGQLSSSASPPSPPRTQQQRHQNHQILLQQQQDDQRQHQRPQQQQRHHSQQREGQKVRPSPTDATNNHREQQQQPPSSPPPPPPQHRHNADDEAEEERDTGGGEVESVIVNEKGDEVESENGKSEVIQLPPTHITKSGRDHHHHHRNHHHHISSGGDGHSGSVSDHSGGGSSRNGGGNSNNKKFTPSISHNEEGGGGTGFKVPTTAISYSDEPPNLNGFVPVVPFHLIDEMREMVTPHSPPRDILSLSSPTTSTPTQQQQHLLVDTIIHNSTPPPSSSTFPTIHDPSSEQNTEHRTQDIIITPTEKQSQFNLHTISHIDYHNSNNPPPHNTSNFTHDETMIQESSPPPPQIEEQKINTLLELNNSEQEHGSVTLGDDETIKLVATSENNHNGLFDTRAVKIANGIKQGEFLLEGYMINSSNNNNNEDGAPFGASPGVGHGSSLSSRSNAEDADYTNNNVDNHMKEENVGHQQHHHGLYDYPDPNDDSLPIIVDEDDAANHSHDNIPLSPVIPQLPGTPALEQYLTPSYLTTTTKNSTPYLFNNPKNPTFSTGSGGSSSSSSSNNSGGVTDDDSSRTTSRQQNGEDVTGNEDFSKSSEPNLVDRNSPSADDRVIVVNSAVDFVEAVPTPPPEVRRTRLSEIDEEKNNFVVADDEDAPTNPFYNSNHNVVNNINKDINIAFFPYYDSYGNKINASQQGISGGGSSSSSSSSSSGSLNKNRDGDDEIFSYSGSGEGAYQYQDENGAFETDQFNGLDKTTIQRDRSLASSSSSSSHANTNNFRSKHTRKSNSKIIKLKMDVNGNFIEDDDDRPSSISIPVEASLNYQINNKNHNGVDSTSNNDGPNYSSSSVGSVGGTSGNSASVVDNINENDGFVGIRKSVGASAAAVEDYGPLYLESSETLINKTYYLDGNYNSIHTTSSTNNGKNKNSNSIKSSNFIKVTRIKTSSGPTSQETAEKTSATILARRTSKPAVIVSTSAAGVRPKVVGSVVEAGPAWPGLVSNFLRTNGQYNTNRSFTATATVRPRGNSGTNPSPPTAVISGQIEQISREQVHQQIHTKHHHRQQSPHTPPPPPQQLQQDPPPTAAIKPTEFQLQQIRTTTVAGISSATTTSSASSIINDPSTNNHESKNRNFANHHQHHQNTNANHNRHNTNSSSSIIAKKGNSAASGVNSNLAKQVSTNSSNQQQPHNIINYNSSSFNINNNSTDSNSTKTHTIARRLYTSSEEIRSNSSTGVVSLVHAHISHCPKLHSPTEVICDVHIREGHGIANPQLTVGWRRKFYNSTQPDVLLALNKAPPSGENGHFDPHHYILEVEPGNYERLEEFHDKFNVTLAPGISPMLRSVLLIRSVTAADSGIYVCTTFDGVNELRSETLLFLCHK